MKILNQILITIVLLQIASCDQVVIADYSLQVHVVDNSGQDLNDAKIFTSRVELTSPLPSGENRMNPVVKTDENGNALIKYKSVHHQSGGPGPGATIEKEGWYSTSVTGDNWTPTTIGNTSSYHAEVKAVLKLMKNPIPMIFHRSCGLVIEDRGRAIGFDLEVGEAVAPHGKGKVADIEIILNGSRNDNGPNEHEDIDFRASLRFPNPLDGYVEFPVEPKDGAHGSSFMSAYEAPADGYANQMDRHGVWGKARGTSQYWKYWHDLEKKGYYFRVRTRLDASGRILSCHYGKIYGAVRLIPTRKRMQNFQAAGEAALTMSEVYFNSTPNDRNMECDTKVNLLRKTDEYGKPFLIDRP